MRCEICGQANVDGALDQYGDFICIDCFADGSAFVDGRKASASSPAQPNWGYVDYSHVDNKAFLDTCNKKLKDYEEWYAEEKEGRSEY